MFSAELLRELWPHADAALIEGIAAAAPAVFPKYGLTSNLTVAQAMAQFSHECGAGLEMTENINYTAARACEVWPSRFKTAQQCFQVVGSSADDPEFKFKLINSVYGGRMGNRQGTSDGSRYIGRGLSQVTGREGYDKLGQKVNLPLLDEPERVNFPQSALECGVADFVLCGCLPFAERDDIDGVTLHLNGGHIGLSERITWLGRWKAALEAASPEPHGTAWIQKSLNTLGADPTLVVDGKFGPLTASTLARFQAQHGLDASGRVSEDTIRAIAAALNQN